MTKPRIKLTLENPNLREAVLIGPFGHAVRTLPLDRKGNKLMLTFPSDGMYVVLR
jgi:hypothetical protein